MSEVQIFTDKVEVHEVSHPHCDHTDCPYSEESPQYGDRVDMYGPDNLYITTGYYVSIPDEDGELYEAVVDELNEEDDYDECEVEWIYEGCTVEEAELDEYEE